MPTTTKPLRRLLILTLLACVLSGCGQDQGRPIDERPELDQARSALDAGEHARAVELSAPHAGMGDEAALILARARAGLARSQTRFAPEEPAALRAALDQVALALPLAGADPKLHAELLTTQRELVARLVLEDTRRTAEATPEPAVLETAEKPAASAPAPVARPARPSAPEAPPVAPPTVAYSVAQRKSFDESDNSGTFASCIDIQVLGPAGPVGGAVIGINNGEHSYQNQTNGDGYTGRCGLGASTWSVVLFWTPAEGDVKGVATTVYVNGDPGQRAAAVFQGS